MANAINNVTTMSELEVAKAAMAVGWVKFSYTKADGSLRIAVGTTNRALIEQVRGYRFPEHRENKSYYSIGGYFDLTRCDWRQYNPDRFGHILYEGVMDNETAVTQAFAILAILDPEDLQSVANLRYLSENFIGVDLTDAIVVNVHKNAVRLVDSYDGRAYEPILLVDKVVSFTADVVPCVTLKVKTTQPTTDRKALVAELLTLRKRESEILELLLL